MRLIQAFLLLVVFLVVVYLGRVVNHKFRTYAQENATLYQVMQAADAISFVSVGGDPFGYENYYKWQYATWLKSSERTWLQKVLFWDVGFIYVANNPPKEYPYPSHFE